jgi:hypothetical protein
MSKLSKLIARFKSQPSDFTIDELRRLLHGFGYLEDTGGRTSGSRLAFVHSKTGHVVRLHHPHPTAVLKHYQVKYILEELRERGEV